MAKQYIEREAVKRELLSWAVSINHPEYLIKDDALHIIDSFPAADVVKVVRCRECDHKTHDGSGRPYCWQLKMYLNKELDFFCKYGKRKEGAN